MIKKGFIKQQGLRFECLLLMIFFLLSLSSTVMAETSLLDLTEVQQNPCYIRLEFHDFPLAVLLRIKKEAYTLEKMLPLDIQIGLKPQQGEAHLIFTYAKNEDKVHLKMALEHAESNGSVSTLNLYYLEKSIKKPSTTVITNTLKDFFISFCKTWQNLNSPQLANMAEELVQTKTPAGESDYLL